MKKGFSLVELMVAVSILSIGIVFILRSFINMVSALDISAAQIEAIQLLDSQACVLEEQLKQEKEFVFEGEEKVVKIGVREARQKIEVTLLELERAEEEQEQEQEELTIHELTMTVAWKQGYKDKKMILSTYICSQQVEE